MQIDHSNVGEITKYSYDIRKLSNKIQSIQHSLNCAWTSKELTYINLALDSTLTDLKKVASELEETAISMEGPE